jgi:hypothetical protein
MAGDLDARQSPRDGERIRNRQRIRPPRHLNHAVGYRVDGPEGYLGRVQRVPLAGRPPQPLTLVVSDGQTARFISLGRIAAVLKRERRIVLWPGTSHN